MWHVFQGLVVIAVGFANIYWQITPNQYVAVLAGVGLAFVLTQALVKLTDLWRERRQGLKG